MNTIIDVLHLVKIIKISWIQSYPVLHHCCIQPAEKDGENENEYQGNSSFQASHVKSRCYFEIIYIHVYMELIKHGNKKKNEPNTNRSTDLYRK